jgi:hypothetical protein
MKISRRSFIKAGTVFTAFAGTNLFIAPAAEAQKINADFAGALPAEVFADPFLYLTSEDFKKYVGSEFSLITETGAIAVVLVNLTQKTKSKLASKKTSGRKAVPEAFTLSFEAEKAAFSQKTYKLFHPNLSEFDLFLVPGENLNGKIRLHAVINRI